MLAGASIFANGTDCVLVDVETVARAATASVGRCDMATTHACEYQ